MQLLMIETETKLNEARHFLIQIKNSLEDPKILGFNLSAFVSAARSVTFIMQREFKGNFQFERWYRAKQEKMKGEDIFVFFNSLRVCTIHIGSIKKNRYISVQINEPPVSIFESVAVTVIRNGEVIQQSSSPLTNSSPPRNLSNVGSTQEIKMHFEGRPQDDGIELCEDYLKRIERLVEECSQIVNSSASSNS